MPSVATRRQSMDAETSAAEKYDYRVVGERKEYVDLISEQNGTYYQCKSAVYEKANGRPGVLRFDLHHLRSLWRESHQCGIVIVLYPSVGSDGWSPLKITRVSVSDVLDLVMGGGIPKPTSTRFLGDVLVDY